MKESESGNVLFYILIAVALLAALSYAVVQSSRGNVQQLGEEKARLAAADLIEYGNAMASAVAQLRLRGVGELELCFDAPAWNGDYDHAGCDDESHKIYSPEGGGLSWAQPAPEALDPASDGLWHFYADNEVNQVGSTCGTSICSELLLVAEGLNLETCLQINDLLGVDNPGDAPPTDSDMGTAIFTGIFNYSETIGNEPGGTALSGQSAACFRKTGAPAEYVFYKVLLAR